jgi:hypothetical protein
MWRQASSMPASTSSFTALALAPGALNTGMPIFVSFSTGMLFTPAPARPTALSDFGISMSCILNERSRMPSGSFMSAETWNSSLGRRASPSGEMLLSVSILCIFNLNCIDK